MNQTSWYPKTKITGKRNTLALAGVLVMGTWKSNECQVFLSRKTERRKKEMENPAWIHRFIVVIIVIIVIIIHIIIHVILHYPPTSQTLFVVDHVFLKFFPWFLVRLPHGHPMMVLSRLFDPWIPVCSVSGWMSLTETHEEMGLKICGCTDCTRKHGGFKPPNMSENRVWMRWWSPTCRRFQQLPKAQRCCQKHQPKDVKHMPSRKGRGETPHFCVSACLRWFWNRSVILRFGCDTLLHKPKVYKQKLIQFQANRI